MNAQAALKNYAGVKVNAAVEGASPHQLIQMLFDGLLERIAQTKGAIEQNNIELKGVKVNQAISILSGLRSSLDTDVDGDLPGRLDGLYDYIQRQLWKAHKDNDISVLAECTSLVNEMSTAWRAMDLESI